MRVTPCATLCRVPDHSSRSASRVHPGSRGAVDPSEPSVPQLVLGVGALMIAAQLAFRAWALYPSWFFTDDYRLMLDASGTHPDAGHLGEPFDSHLMPLARLLAWLVTDVGTLNWYLAATITLAVQLLASVACLWMLVTLFGRRWFILVPLAVYLTSAVSAPAFMWWAASVNQLPLQVVFFTSVGLWVTYLRSRRLRQLVLTLVVVVIGIGFYEKTLILGVVLAFLALGWFASGSPRQRVAHVLRRYWPAAVLGAALAGGYLAYYVTHVPRPFESNGAGDFVADDVANTMLGTALPTGLLGGPWRWFNTSPPIVLAGPPPWAVHLTWMALLLVVLYGALRRARTLRAWALMATYAGVLFAILAVSRGQIFGGLSGLEYRYLTDGICAFVLVLGLVFAELEGAVESSVPRAEPILTWEATPRVVVLVTALVAVGGLVSTVQYVQFWHHDNASRSYVKTLSRDLRTLGPVDLGDTIMPPTVMPAYTTPKNHTAVFAPLVSSNARFPSVSDDLHVVADDGSVVPAVIKGGVVARPGPDAGCGWKVERGLVTIPMDQSTFDFTWWIRIGYLGSNDDTISVTVDGKTVLAPVERGLHSLFVKADGAFGGVTLGGLQSGTTLCVDDVQVGNVSAEESG